MTITKDKVVSIEYTLKDESGNIIDTSKGNGALDYLHGHGNLIPGLERELEGKEKGASLSVTIDPKDGYGEYREELVVSVPKKQFDTDVEIEVGMQFEAGTPEGGQIVTVTEVKDDTVTIDANHPLAGKKLFFDVDVVEIRDGTQEEIEGGLNRGGCGGDCGGCGGNCGEGSCGDGECGSGCGCSCGE